MQYNVSAPDVILSDNPKTAPYTIHLPASKSLSNRALIMKGLCADECRLGHLSECDDTAVMIKAFENPEAKLIDIGAAGTSMRFLTAFLARRAGQETTITGSERMRQRPIRILVEALRQLGADISYEASEGCPPLHIHGKKLSGGRLCIDGSVSSQYISALLMIAPCLENGLTLELTGKVISTPYILMTLGLMREFGIESTWEKNIIRILPQRYIARDFEVESDWSAASYWYEVMALTKIPSIELLGLHADSLQGDAQIAQYFKPLGIITHYHDKGVTLTRQDTQIKNIQWDLSGQPDLAQTLIATCCAKGIAFDICGLQTLRIKETDRISALQNELRKLGYEVKDHNNCRMTWDGIRQAAQVKAPLISTYEDHRMAMAFAPLAAVQDSLKLCIDNPQVVTKSYPTFWQDLQTCGYKIDSISC